MSEATPQVQVERMLGDAARQVLETMFFTSYAEGTLEAPDPDPAIAVEIRFRGNPPGRFRLRIGRPGAEELAAAFLGVEPGTALPPEEVVDVARELANVICGTALSRLEAAGAFELGSPTVVGPREPEPVAGQLHCQVPLDCGTLQLWLSPDLPA